MATADSTNFWNKTKNHLLFFTIIFLYLISKPLNLISTKIANQFFFSVTSFEPYLNSCAIDAPKKIKTSEINPTKLEKLHKNGSKVNFKKYFNYPITDNKFVEKFTKKINNEIKQTQKQTFLYTFFQNEQICENDGSKSIFELNNIIKSNDIFENKKFNVKFKKIKQFNKPLMIK